MDSRLQSLTPTQLARPYPFVWSTPVKMSQSQEDMDTDAPGQFVSSGKKQNEASPIL